jgi:hypothetical protein
MISVIEMTACENDVDIKTQTKFQDDADVREIYNHIKNYCMGVAEHVMLSTQGRTNYLVEMSDNDEGLPHASIYDSGVITKQVFATRR